MKGLEEFKKKKVGERKLKEGARKDVIEIKRSVRNLNLEECTIFEWIGNKQILQNFHDMNKLFIEDDEINSVKRRPRTKPELEIVRPW